MRWQDLTAISSGRKWRRFHDRVCEMEAIVSVDGSRWSRCCNINSSVSTCWNTAAAFLQATALPPINRPNVAVSLNAQSLLQQLTLSPRLLGNDIHIHTSVCRKDIFYSDHFLLVYVFCHDSRVVGIHHSVEGWDLQIKFLSTCTQPQGCGKNTWIMLRNNSKRYFEYFRYLYTSISTYFRGKCCFYSTTLTCKL